MLSRALARAARTAAHVPSARSWRFWIAVGALASVAFAVPAARALTTVANTLDSGPGSLRQAIIDAPAGDTIDFAVTGTITLTSGALVITKDVTISGPGSGVLAVSGNDVSTVFSIPKNIGPALSVAITNLTIQNGNAALTGGGIDGADNVVSVSGCAFHDNFATDGGGAIFSGKFGTVNVSASTFVGNSAGRGGALVIATSTLSDSTFTDNTATGGGAVTGDPTISITVTRCTFSRNVAFEDGGAILSDEPGTLAIADSTFDGNQAGRTGGAIYRDAPLTVSNSTFSGNRATGGLNRDGSAIFLEGTGTPLGAIANCTFTGNRVTGTAVPGSAVDLAGASVSMRNTIVANNTPTNCAVSAPGVLTSEGHNLDSGTSCGFAATGDLSSTAPLLGPLANNGGPTLTHALLAGSPAIDAGDPAAPGSGGTACTAADQRGITRPHLVACDIGAYERACGDTVVDSGAGEQCDDGNAVDGDGCDSNCTVTGCGNGIVTSGEQCDDGNTVSGDCCSATCQFESGGSSCLISGSPCTTIDTCDGTGHCQRGPQASCIPGKPIVGGKASVQLKAFVKTTKNQFRWKWIKGALTLKNDFGNPVTGTTDYLLCVYDGTGLVTTAHAPHAGLCNASNPVPCWKETGKGYKYNDKDRTPDGVQKLKLKADLAGKAKINLKAKGKLFHMPFPGGLVSPVTVQLRNTGNACWQAIYSFPPAQKNTGAQFKDKSDPP